ncbi:hypothetical protein M3Y98_00524200 [Aphelenchoides besseyi]|nr:hypothetical protein M3Y98_00524200 [Aphelenchoides besseyi]KAI6207978.1 hypothetical protein M3Y96_00065900 [Aphelenchoides besseyi]
MAPFSDPQTWNDRLKHATYWRREVKRSFGDSISHLQVLDGLKVRDREVGPVLVGLGSIQSVDGTAPLQTVVYASLDEATNGRLELRPLIKMEGFAAFEDRKLSPELTLYYERTRGHIWSGIMSYSVHHESRRILMSTVGGIFVYKNGVLETVADWCQSEPINATFSTFDPDFVAFCTKGQLYIDCKNRQVFTTASDESNSRITNGLASFVVQEELERDEGFWWSPRRCELIYERVDEREVCELSFTIPGKSPQSPLREFVDRPLSTFLDSVLPEYKDYYIARAGWADDGESFFVMIMNRYQSRRTIVNIGKAAFTFTNSKPQDLPIKVIYEEQSTVWINHNNATFFLPSTPEAPLRMIYASEKTNYCHLYVTGSPQGEFTITSGSWPVIKDVTPTVDDKRQQIYYLANCISPVKTSLCVSSYKSEANQMHRIITPTQLCYKFDRTENRINVNPEVGFACWLSNLRQLPECHFYGLIHRPDQLLPDSEFRYRVRLQSSIPSTLQTQNSINSMKSKLNVPSNEDEPMSPATPSQEIVDTPIVPESLFTHRFYEVKLDDGTIINCLVLLPASDSKRNPFEPVKYPVIHYVYGGPGLQVVRDSWITASQFLKFLSVGYAIFTADSRGSSNRGVQFESVIKNRMGSVEVDDQVFSLRAVSEMCPEIDLNRVGVTGWSYGGYMSLQMLAQHSDLYRCSCAAAAVTDWSLYDTCYTERYMGPVDQSDAYKTSSILSRISSFPDDEDRLLIIHGLIDDNVHFHHTEKLINALINAGKPHRLLLFPSERHGIRKAEAVEFLHANMLSFFDRSLKS